MNQYNKDLQNTIDLYYKLYGTTLSNTNLAIEITNTRLENIKKLKKDDIEYEPNRKRVV